MIEEIEKDLQDEWLGQIKQVPDMTWLKNEYDDFFPNFSELFFDSL